MEWDFPAADCTQYCVHVTVFKEEKCVREMGHREQKACNMLCHESLLLLSIYVDHMYTICIHMSHTYICDRSQSYGAMYHLTFLFIPLLRKAHIYSRKKIILTWWQKNNKTIPTGWKALHICSRVLYFYPAAFYVCIYMYNCMCIYIYIYKSTCISFKGYRISVWRCNFYVFSFLYQMYASLHCSYKISALSAISSIHQLFLICSKTLFI